MLDIIWVTVERGLCQYLAKCNGAEEKQRKVVLVQIPL